MNHPELRKTAHPGVRRLKGRPAEIARRVVNSPLVAVGLGILSVVASLAIGYFAYKHSLNSGAARLRQFGLSKAKQARGGHGSLRAAPRQRTVNGSRAAM